MVDKKTLFALRSGLIGFLQRQELMEVWGKLGTKKED